MASTFSARLEGLQDMLRLALMAVRDHRTGARTLQNADFRTIEDLLFMHGFELAEFRLDLHEYEEDTERKQAEFLRLAKVQNQALLDVVSKLQCLAPGVFPQAVPPVIPANVVVFTRSYRPAAQNDVGGAS